jgi:hypothetical protein
LLELITMLKLPSLIPLVFCAGAALAQTTQPGQTTPSVTPSQTPAVTPSQTPAVTPSQTPAVNPQSQPPTTQSPTAVAPGGMSQCQNMIGADRDTCLQNEKRPAGTGSGAAGTQNTAPAGAVR